MAYIMKRLSPAARNRRLSLSNRIVDSGRIVRVNIMRVADYSDKTLAVHHWAVLDIIS